MHTRTRVGKSFLLNCLLMMGECTREQYESLPLVDHKLEAVQYERTGIITGGNDTAAEVGALKAFLVPSSNKPGAGEHDFPCYNTITMY